MNQLLIYDGYFYLSFPYDLELVRRAKGIPGAQWYKQRRMWRYPISEVTYNELKEKFGVSLLEFEQRNNNGYRVNLSTRKFKTKLYNHQEEGLKFLLQRMGVEVES